MAMDDPTAPPRLKAAPKLMTGLGWLAAIGCLLFPISVFIADLIVPNHNWISDTISDLGAGRYEFIVDIGLYAFSAAFVAVSLLCAHLHMGGDRWSIGVVGLAALGLIIFLVGARNEYGDGDTEGVVIHSYLVYALGILMVVVPWCLSEGLMKVSRLYSRALSSLALLWLVAAPPYFFLPTEIDGLYERGLGLIAIALIAILARFFVVRARNLT